MIGIPFAKLEGAGNDYVYLDGIAHDLPTEFVAARAAAIADRHFGVGGDGVIRLGRSTVADCRMEMWNADGSRGAMCGNGLRCLAHLAAERGHVVTTNDVVTVETDVGIRQVELLRDPSAAIHGARIDLGRVHVSDRPRTITVAGRSIACHTGDAGNPHAVVFLDADPTDRDVLDLGTAFQSHAAFPGGVNVEFVRVAATDTLVQRTFERGSGETLACGTGAAVAATTAIATGRCRGPVVAVQLRGGVLTVERVSATRTLLAGPSRMVAIGTWFEPAPPLRVERRSAGGRGPGICPSNLDDRPRGL